MSEQLIREVLERYQLPFTMRPDQYKTCVDLVGWPRAGLYCEVGTGKTVLSTVIALAWGADINVVTMPPILLRSWQRWLQSIGGIDGVMIYRGTPKERAAMPIHQAKWLLMSMAIFKKDHERLARAFIGKKKTLIVDEATSIKNPGTDNHKLTKSFSEGHNLALLTGTPLSSPHDAYAYVRLISPQIYRSKGQFDNIHVDELDFFGNVVSWKNLDLMQENLMQHSVRLLKENVLKDLHKPNYIPIEYELEPSHFALYKELAEEQLLILENGGKIDATTAPKLYNALQQIIVNWDYFSGNEDARSATFDLIDMVMDEAEVMNPSNSKLIIYTYYQRTSAKILEYLQEFSAVGCYGAISQKRQSDNLDKFLFDPKTRILVAQPLSGGVGFNPQQVCSEVLFIESPSIPWHFIQAVGRVYRDGQPRVPNVHIGIASGTIQHRLHARLLAQDALLNQVQGGFQDLRDAIYGR
jgi:SNF2 family DNA or RNA helicase